MNEINFEMLIPKENVNHFFNILQFLGKIGKDVIFEVDADLLTLRSLNDAKSAFASVEFASDFFQMYDLRSPRGESFACKMAVKPLCSVLKNSKKLQSLRLYNNRQETGEMEMIFAMSCNHGILRTHRFIYRDTDIVNAMFDESAPSCSRMRCEPKVLAQLFGHIHHRLVGEVSIGLSRTTFKVKTFHSDRANRSISLHDSSMASILSSSSAKSHMTSEMCLDPRNEFDQFEYRNRESTQEIIVCCKEIKSLLWLAEASEIPSLNLFLTEGGRPIKFNCEIIPHSVVVTLIMATLEPRPSVPDSQTQPLTNGTGRTISGRELQAELDEEEGRITPMREADESDEGTQSIAGHTPATPSTSTPRSRTSNTSSIKRKYPSNQSSEEEEEGMILQQHELVTPQKSHRTSSTSPGGNGSNSPGIAYLGGMTRLRKIIMDEEDDS